MIMPTGKNNSKGFLDDSSYGGNSPIKRQLSQNQNNDYSMQQGESSSRMQSKQSKNKLRVSKKISDNVEFANRSQMNENPSQQGIRSGNASQHGSGTATQSEFLHQISTKKGFNTVKKKKKKKAADLSQQLDEFDALGHKK